MRRFPSRDETVIFESGWSLSGLRFGVGGRPGGLVYHYLELTAIDRLRITTNVRSPTTQHGAGLQKKRTFFFGPGPDRVRQLLAISSGRLPSYFLRYPRMPRAHLGFFFLGFLNFSGLAEPSLSGKISLRPAQRRSVLAFVPAMP